MLSNALHIEVSWPARELSPNGRAHPLVQHRFKKAAKTEAGWATKIARPLNWAPPEGEIPIHLIAHPKPGGPLPDKDNLIASLKAYFDGVADALGINDRTFAAPTVEFAERTTKGGVVIVVGAA